MNIVWIAYESTDDNIKKAQLITWYINYCTVNPRASIAETQTALNKEFSKPKFDSHLVIEFKDIMMKVEEMPREFDQRLKC